MKSPGQTGSCELGFGTLQYEQLFLDEIPEALALVHQGGGKAIIHRVTDFGTHGLVDLHLSDGTRVKCMVASPEPFHAGETVALNPRAFAAFRDNVKLYGTTHAQ